MNDREQLKKTAKKIAVIMVVAWFLSHCYFYFLLGIELEILLISAPLALIIPMAIVALIYFWKGPIK